MGDQTDPVALAGTCWRAAQRLIRPGNGDAPQATDASDGAPTGSGAMAFATRSSGQVRRRTSMGRAAPGLPGPASAEVPRASEAADLHGTSGAGAPATGQHRGIEVLPASDGGGPPRVGATAHEQQAERRQSSCGSWATLASLCRAAAGSI